MINRRQWLCGMAVMASAAAQPGSAFGASKEETQQTVSHSLSLAEFSPKSMLQVPETHVARARFPVIDFHTHITRTAKQGPRSPPVACHWHRTAFTSARRKNFSLLWTARMSVPWSISLAASTRDWETSFPNMIVLFRTASMPLLSLAMNASGTSLSGECM